MPGIIKGAQTDTTPACALRCQTPASLGQKLGSHGRAVLCPSSTDLENMQQVILMQNLLFPVFFFFFFSYMKNILHCLFKFFFNIILGWDFRRKLMLRSNSGAVGMTVH